MRIGTVEVPSQLALAPMAGVTDAAFRRWRQNGRVSINPGSGSGNDNNQWIIGPWIKPPKPWIKDSLIVKPIEPFEPALRDSTIITVKPKKTR